jgi:anti-sigma regulatory factor (Ser/Thr protein kinase)
VVELPADLTRVAELAPLVHAACAAANLDAVAIMDLELAVAEAANNIVGHGYCADARQTYSVVMRAEAGLVEIELVDRGVPIPPALLEAAAEVKEDAECGRGLVLMRACVDEIDYRSSAGENHLTLRKRCTA